MGVIATPVHVGAISVKISSLTCLFSVEDTCAWQLWISSLLAVVCPPPHGFDPSLVTLLSTAWISLPQCNESWQAMREYLGSKQSKM